MAEDYKTLAKRVSALEEENQGLRADLDALSKRVGVIDGQAGAARSKSPGKRPSTATPARPGSSVSSNGLKKSASKTSVKSNGSVKAPGKKPELTERKKSMDASANIDPSRLGSYHVGKRKVHYILPQGVSEAAADPSPPAADLELEWVYGYNGKSARQNLYYAHDNKGLLYCIAGVGVYHDAQAKVQRFFRGHNEDIVSFAVHPTKPIAATGQVDPKGKEKPFVCIWNYETMELISSIKGAHDRGIIALAFNGDGKYLASIGDDDSHSLYIWDWEADNKKPFISNQVSKDEVFGLVWNPFPAESKDQEFITFGVKHIKIWTMSGKELKSVIPSSFNKTKVVQKAFNSAAFLPNGEAVVATETGEIYVYKDKDFSKAVAAHEVKVGAVARTKNGYVSAASDGTVIFWNNDHVQVGKNTVPKRGFVSAAVNDKTGVVALGTSKNEIVEVGASGPARTITETHSGEIWGLAVHPTEPVIATGAHDRAIRLWNTKTRSAVEGRVYEFANDKKLKGEGEAVRSAAFSPDGNLLAVGLRSGKIAIIDYHTWEVKYEKKHRGEQIDALTFSPNGQLLALGSWDQMAELIDLESYSSVVLKGHTSSITHLGFSVDSKYLQTNSRDYEILYWDTETGKRVDKSVVADVDWFDWSNILGWPVRAIFTKGMDGTDINAVNVSASKSLIATGDDSGQVSLWRYPALSAKAQPKTFNGHSSHVTNVRFSKDESHLFSAGGLDYGVFQWRVNSN